MKTSFRAQSGFTLLEVMIAVTILAAISLGLFGATTQVLSSKDLVESRDEVQHSVTFALNRMAQDLGMAYFTKSPELLGAKFEGEISFLGTENRLDFVSLSHLRYLKNVPEGESIEVSYYLVPSSEGGDRMVLMRRQATEIDRQGQEGGTAYPLLDGVRSIDFKYLPVNNDEWKTTWDTRSVDAQNTLPRAVQISLEVYFPEEEEPRIFTWTAPIRLRKPLNF